MLILFIGVVGAASVVLGKWVFGKWWNHVSLYSLLWSGSLLLFELRLINYYPLEEETWMIIIAGWISYVVGSITVTVARWSRYSTNKSNFPPRSEQFPDSAAGEQLLLERMLWIINIVTLIAAIQNWYIVIQKFGSITNVLVRGALVYSLHVQETVPGKMPYLGSLCLVSSLLAGVYTAKIGRIRLAAILPIVICILVDLSNMTRALMILDGIIFSVGYFVTRGDERVKSSSVPEHKLRRLILVVALLGMLVGGAELARSTRHANEDIVGASRTLQNLQFSSLITPSVYMYMTAHHGVLNQYLKHDGEHGIWGGNTLAPMYRGLDKLGFQTYVSQYQTFYKTPVGANTGTYLRELHADFGIPGVLIVPYIFGFLTSFFWYKYADTSRYIYLALLGYFMVVTGMSVFYLATRLGYLLVYLLGSIFAAILLDMSKRVHSLNNTVNVSPA